MLYNVYDTTSPCARPMHPLQRFSRSGGQALNSVDLGLVRSRLSRAIWQLRGKSVDTMKLVIKSGRVEERPQIEAIVVGTIRLHVNGGSDGGPEQEGSVGMPNIKRSHMCTYILCRLIACVKKKCLTLSAIYTASVIMPLHRQSQPACLCRRQECAPFLDKFPKHAVRSALLHLSQSSKHRQLVVCHAHLRLVRLDSIVRPDGDELGRGYRIEETGPKAQRSTIMIATLVSRSPLQYRQIKCSLGIFDERFQIGLANSTDWVDICA